MTCPKCSSTIVFATGFANGGFFYKCYECGQPFVGDASEDSTNEEV